MWHLLKQHTPTIFASWFSNVLHKALSFSQLNHDWNVTIRLLYALTPLFSHLSRLFSCHEVYWMTHSTCLSCTGFNELSQIIQCSIHSIFPVLSLRFPHFFFYNCNFCLQSNLLNYAMVTRPHEGTSIGLIWTFFIVFQRIQKVQVQV